MSLIGWPLNPGLLGLVTQNKELYITYMDLSVPKSYIGVVAKSLKVLIVRMVAYVRKSSGLLLGCKTLKCH